jgi:Zn-dependent protease
MTDPLSWSIGLGRWGGTQVRIHVFLVFFALGQLFDALLAKGQPVGETITWLGLLLAALALHELGHAAMAAHLGYELEEIRLWPLGSLTDPSTSAASRSPEAVYVALAGPGLSGLLAIISAIGLKFTHAQLVFYPLAPGGTPTLDSGGTATPYSAVWCVGWFGYLNWMLCLLNLIPALPLDMGRVWRAIWQGPTRDNLVAPWTAHVCATILGIFGFVRLFQNAEQGMTLVFLAFLVEWMVRSEARMIEEGAFFDEGEFGYDFSQGYTSLESSQPKVRPYRESALKRWRRRRSELRRQRRIEREAAEEQRMDEILEKLYRSGRGSLTDEEHRFLVRVSAKYKNRARARE